jgi:hypothetical protein
MKKIPVGATIAHAYRFAFGNFVTVLRVIWIPLAVQLALSILLLTRTAQFLSATQAHDPAAPSLFRPLLLLYPIFLVLFFMQLLLATEIALNPHSEPSGFHFPLGKKLWRLVGGFLMAGLAILALMIAAILGSYLLGILVQAGINTMPPAGAKLASAFATLIFFFLGLGGIIFVGVRFLFLLGAVNVAERRLGVGRAWLLSRRNFWRAFAVILVVAFPFTVVNYGAMFALAGMPQIPHGATVEAVQAARMAWNIKAISAMAASWYIVLPAYGILIVLYFGAGCSAQAFAYRALTEDEGLAPVAGD